MTSPLLAREIVASETMFGADYWYVIAAFVFLAGACVGSFLNVCIYRIPNERSIITPGSRCYACGKPLKFWMNLPILSWFLLRGRAGCCDVKLDSRYLMVELLTAICFVLLWWWYWRTPELFFAYAVFVGMLIAGSGVDIDLHMIPNRFTLGLAVVGIVASALVPELHDADSVWASVKTSLWGAFLGALILFVIAQIGEYVFKKPAMGLGDVKLMAGLGAFLGPESIAWVIPISAMVGSVWGIWLILGSRGSWGTAIPYGPFLAVAAILYPLIGHVVVEAYIEEIARTFDNRSVF
ncbi:MAG: A24 family peptidase [Verrucomicrobiota bacterium]